MNYAHSYFYLYVGIIWGHMW